MLRNFAFISLFALLLAACGSDPDSADGGVDDGGSTADAGADAGTDAGPDGGSTGCGAVTFFGECDGTLLRFCGEDTAGNDLLQEFDCGDASLNCALISADWGYDCAEQLGLACTYDDPDYGYTYNLCEGTEAACVETGTDSTCTDAVGVCTDPDIGTCWDQDLVQDCYAGQPWIYRCQSDGQVCQNGACIPSSAETCNDLDDDGDGSTDEDFMAGGTVTHTDLDGTTGLVLADACGTGLCTGGAVACDTATTGLTCSTAGSAVTETCNTLDDDCDGQTDEDYVDLQTPCDGMDADECATGTWTCTTDGTGLECVNEATPGITEACNSLDDDCDGQTDEDYSTGGSITLTDLDGTTGLALGDGCGTGLCTGGTVACDALGTGLTCPSHAAVITELPANSIDDDCDGQTDEP